MSTCLLLLGALAAAPQERDAAAVLKEMRAALGGDAVLDAIKTISIRGTIRTAHGGRTAERDHELLIAFPDRFIRIVRVRAGVTLPGEINVYTGLNGTEPIFKIEARGAIRFEKLPSMADASEAEKAGALIRRRQELTRLSLVLLGKPLSTDPLEFTYAGREEEHDRTYEVIEATDEQKMAVRLHVDTRSHLPVMLSFLGDPPLPVVPPGQTIQVPITQVERRWFLSDFKPQDGANWPRRLEDLVGGNVIDDIRFRNIKVNPSIDPRRFQVK